MGNTCVMGTQLDTHILMSAASLGNFLLISLLLASSGHVMVTVTSWSLRAVALLSRIKASSGAPWTAQECVWNKMEASCAQHVCPTYRHTECTILCHALRGFSDPTLFISLTQSQYHSDTCTHTRTYTHTHARTHTHTHTCTHTHTYTERSSADLSPVTR